MAVDDAMKRLSADAAGADYHQFQERYWSDPAGFCRDCIIWPDAEALTYYQDEILTALPEQLRVSIRGPHGIGKSAVSALIVLWFALTRDGRDWKIITTASAWRQLTRYLWPEIHKWGRRLDWSRIGRDPLDLRRELLTLNLRLATGEASAAASNNEAYIEGAHADHLLYVFDEAKAIPSATFDAAEGAFSGAGGDTDREAYAIAISTPGEPEGRFYDIHRRAVGTENWWTRHVTLAEAIASGRVSRQWADQMARLWGVSSAQYQNRVLGEFAANDEDGVIPLSWIELAQDRWREIRDSGTLDTITSDPCTSVALDVADGGPDRSIMAIRHGQAITTVRDVSTQAAGETMALAGRVRGLVSARGGVAIIDSVGVGAGVLSRLREQGVRAVAFNAGSAAKDRRGRPLRDASGELAFRDVRSAAHWRLRELLDPESGEDVAICASDDRTADGKATVAERILGDLAAPRWRVDSGGRVVVEPKDAIRKRLGRSTDYGDAIIMAFWHTDDSTPTMDASARSERGHRSELAGIREEAW